MYLSFASGKKLIFTVVLVGTFGSVFAGSAMSATGSFLAVLNEGNNGDSVRSVMFFDANDFSQGPLFSVNVGYELDGFNTEEMGTITVDPNTGDVYVLAFDNFTAGGDPYAEAGTDDGFDDTLADYDLLRINFATVYDYWVDKHMGKDVRTLVGADAVGGPAPTLAANDSPTNHKLDYVNYGRENPSVFPDFPANNSNTHVLNSAIEKVGEIHRNLYSGASSFFPASLDFIDADTLFMIDDSLETRGTLSEPGPDNPDNDQAYRLIHRVSTTDGAATTTLQDRDTSTTYNAGDYLDGGTNRGTTESWESELVGFVHMDVDSGTGMPISLSEPESSAYYHDPLSGVKGVWITERDMPDNGDDIAFYTIDDPSNSGNNFTYREHQVGAGPTYPRQFALDDDPLAGDNKGKADHIFVDQDSGDLIIVDSGFNDIADGVAGVDTEPGVMRRTISAYDNGLGRIQFGAWDAKVLLDPTKDTGDTALERGQWAAWDSEHDRMIFAAPGTGSESPTFQMDIYVLNLNHDCDGTPTGTCDAAYEASYGVYGDTTSFNNLDESYNLFLGDSFGDKLAFFSLGVEEPILVGDYNDDGKVSAADYTVWRDHVGDITLPNRDPNNGGLVDIDDYDSWIDNYGSGTFGSGSGSSVASTVIPEPASIALVIVGLIFLASGVHPSPRSLC